jgi:hypothetical protein
MTHINAVHTLSSYFFNIRTFYYYLSIYTYVFQLVSSLQVVRPRSVNISNLSHTCHMPAHLVVDDLIALINSGREYKL